MKISGKEYDLTALEGVDQLSDLIDSAQVNSAKSIAYQLMQEIISINSTSDIKTKLLEADDE